MNIPLNCKRWPRNEETAPTPNTRARVNWGLPMHGGSAALVAWCCLNQSCCRELLATAFQDEPKCHCSLSRNSNYDVSLLLRCQVLELLVNTEKQQHRLWQCSMFLGFLLKTQNSTVGFWCCVPKQKITWSRGPTIIPWGPARLSNGIHPEFQCPDLSSWLWQNVPMKCLF